MFMGGDPYHDMLGRFTHPEDAVPAKGPQELEHAWQSHVHVGLGEAPSGQFFHPGDLVYTYSPKEGGLIPAKVTEDQKGTHLVTLDTGHGKRLYRPELVAHRDRLHETTAAQHRALAAQTKDKHLRDAHLAAAAFLQNLEHGAPPGKKPWDRGPGWRDITKGELHRGDLLVRRVHQPDGTIRYAYARVRMAGAATRDGLVMAQRVRGPEDDRVPAEFADEEEATRTLTRGELADKFYQRSSGTDRPLQPGDHLVMVASDDQPKFEYLGTTTDEDGPHVLLRSPNGREVRISPSMVSEDYYAPEETDWLPWKGWPNRPEPPSAEEQVLRYINQAAHYREQAGGSLPGEVQRPVHVNKDFHYALTADGQPIGIHVGHEYAVLDPQGNDVSYMAQGGWRSDWAATQAKEKVHLADLHRAVSLLADLHDTFAPPASTPPKISLRPQSALQSRQTLAQTYIDQGEIDLGPDTFAGRAEANPFWWVPMAYAHTPGSHMTSTVAHEYGHFLERYIAPEVRQKAFNLVKTTPTLDSQLSEYGHANMHEAWAEAFTEYALSATHTENEVAQGYGILISALRKADPRHTFPARIG